MKTTRISVFMVFVALFLLLPVNQPAAADTTGGLPITGVVSGGQSGVLVAIDVYAPGYTQESVMGGINASQAIAYRDQTVTSEGGRYAFLFHPKAGYGTYTAYLKAAGQSGTMVRKIEYTAEGLTLLPNTDILSFTTGKTGNIFAANDPLSFQMTLLSKEEMPVDYTLRYEIKENGNVIYSHSDSLVIQPFTITKNVAQLDFKRFGIFELDFTLASDYGEQKISLPFSIVNTPEEPNPEFGVNTHLDMGRSANLYLMNTAGISFVRDECRWNTYEKTAGVYQMSAAYQNYMNSLKNNGSGMIQLLDYSNTLYGSENPPASTAMIQAFGDYCYHLASDLKGYTNEFELWNEWNAYGSAFNPDSATPETYAHLLMEVYQRVKEANQDAKVYAMATGGMDSSFVSRVLKELSKYSGRYFDGVTLHPYMRNSARRGIDPAASDQWPKYYAIRQALTQYGYDVPIVASEVGYSTYTAETTEEEQAIFLMRYLIENRVNGWFQKMCWYELTDGGTNNAREDLFGLTRAYTADIPLEAKPSYLVAANYNSLFQTAQFQEDNSANGICNYRFAREDGTVLRALWTDGGASFYEIPVGSNPAFQYDFYGNKTPLAVQNGVCSVLVTKTPVFVAIGSSETVLQLYQNNQLLSALNQTVPGDVLQVKAFLSEADAAKNPAVTVAVYQDGILKLTKQHFAEANLVEYPLDLPSGYDAIKLFCWNLTNCLPLVQNVTLQ